MKAAIALVLLCITISLVTIFTGNALHGDIIIFSRDGCIYEIDVRSGRENRFSLCGISPALSTDNTHVAFIARTNAAITDIFTASMPFCRGDTRLPLTNTEQSEFAPSWSPDGSHIAYWENTAASVGRNLLVVEVASGAAHLLATVEVLFPSLSWSPDGRWLAFSQGGTFDTQELFIIDVNSGEQRQLTANNFNERAPAWSPDGVHLAYSAQEIGGLFLYIMDIGSGERFQVTSSITGDMPAWSPDGQQLTFVSDSNRPEHDLYIINIDGSGLRRLTNTPYSSETEPSWMP